MLDVNFYASIERKEATKDWESCRIFQNTCFQRKDVSLETGDSINV